MVFQKHALMPWLNVVENVEFGLMLQGRGRAERREVALRNLHLVGLDGFVRATGLRALGRHAAAGRARPGADQRSRDAR